MSIEFLQTIFGRLVAKIPARRGPVALERLAGLLEAPDGHLVTLKDSFVGYVMPSKIYACIESKRPIIFCGSAESDVDLLAREAVPRGDYWRVSCGDPAGFASALTNLGVHQLRNKQYGEAQGTFERLTKEMGKSDAISLTSLGSAQEQFVAGRYAGSAPAFQASERAAPARYPARRATIARTSSRPAGRGSTERWIVRPSIMASSAGATKSIQIFTPTVAAMKAAIKKRAAMRRKWRARRK